ncbi:hypothetical protein, partial [Pseudomonas savastanoi]|uniref:hypothetical protein n=1 Tax=Pseudomonas savastanoi TaxID=29438 RepID=UPI001F37D157
MTATTTSGRSTGGRRPRTSGKPRPPRQWRPGAVPPYAKNPHRVATVADIEQRARMLFDPLKRPADKALV